MLEHSLPNSGLSNFDNKADSDAPERGCVCIHTVSSGRKIAYRLRQPSRGDYGVGSENPNWIRN